MSALTIDRVTVQRGPRAVLDDVSVIFAAGRLTAVIGPNGAGKSTLLDVAAGLLKPSSGKVRLGGTELGDLGRRKLSQRRAYLPQRAGVEWPITVERVVALGLTPALPAFGGLPSPLLPAIEDALKACDLLHLRERPANQLSGGELARAMLARAIVGDPELLIVDEPTAGLDPRHAIDAARRLRVRADAGRTVIMAIHDLDLALNHDDDLVAVRDGRLLAFGPVAKVATEGLLSDLYDVRVRILTDGEGTTVRFLQPRE
jgi:iron complex transport system ATP-binding protein